MAMMPGNAKGPIALKTQKTETYGAAALKRDFGQFIEGIHNILIGFHVTDFFEEGQSAAKGALDNVANGLQHLEGGTKTPMGLRGTALDLAARVEKFELPKTSEPEVKAFCREGEKLFNAVEALMKNSSSAPPPPDTLEPAR